MRLALFTITSFAVTLSACPTPAFLCEDDDDCGDGFLCSNGTCALFNDAGVGEGEGEGEEPCPFDSAPCDDGIACTIDDRCFGTFCLGVHDGSADCAPCEVDCSDTCALCCSINPADLDGECADGCGTCLYACGEGCDLRCGVDTSCSAQMFGSPFPELTCDGATCFVDVVASGDGARATCDNGADCRVKMSNTTGAQEAECFGGSSCEFTLSQSGGGDDIVRCEGNVSCNVVVSETIANIDCNDGSNCNVDCAQGACSMTCGFGANCIISNCTNAGCFLDCGLQSTCVCDGTLCPPGETCDCSG